MMTLKVKLDEGAKMPTKAHDTDAGFDLYSRENKYIPTGTSEVFDTGVHIEIPKGYVGFIKSKSGLNVNHNIVSEGVIDSGYTGSIVVKLYNHSPSLSYPGYHVNAGDKISQIVFLPIPEVEFEQVDEFLEITERGDNGFGSSGR